MTPVSFFNQDVDIKLSNKTKIADWLTKVANGYDQPITQLNYIFCSDQFLLELNKQYLNHDFFTDILTFDMREPGEELKGDIYVSTDRVAENANRYVVPFEIELYRVMAHGLLHLIGYRDSTESEKQAMKEAEDQALSLLPFS